MKYGLIFILFLVSLCSWWTGEKGAAVSAVPDTGIVREDSDASGQRGNKVISVVAAANSCADISVRPSSSSFFSQLARRYRSVGFGLEDLFENLVGRQSAGWQIAYKTTVHLSEEQHARLKNAGYYIYTLRKIII